EKGRKKRGSRRKPTEAGFSITVRRVQDSPMSLLPAVRVDQDMENASPSIKGFLSLLQKKPMIKFGLSHNINNELDASKASV
ncbi:MAG: hypothetical protein KJ645_12180, partial [Planctomycetes bacterium]|nr:hypothetical protein [Planctomycetota bacterium]